MEARKRARGAKVTRPALRYYGGKFALAPWITKHLPRTCVECYVEPYMGAASRLTRDEYRYPIEVINDLDGEVVNFFEVLRDCRARFEDWVKGTPFSRELYERACSMDPEASDFERACALYLRSWQGRGSCRV